MASRSNLEVADVCDVPFRGMHALQVEEHLRFYARIKGVDSILVRKVARSKMDEMNLGSFRTIKVMEIMEIMGVVGRFGSS